MRRDSQVQNFRCFSAQYSKTLHPHNLTTILFNFKSCTYVRGFQLFRYASENSGLLSVAEQQINVKLLFKNIISLFIGTRHIEIRS